MACRGAVYDDAVAATDDLRNESGIEVKPVYTAADAPRPLEPPGESPFTRGPYPDMYRGRPWTIRQYAGFASRRGVERALPLPARPRPDGTLGRVRPADAARLRLRRRARARRGRPHRRRDRLARRHGDPARRDPARRRLDVDDDQRAGVAAAPALRARRGRPGRRGRRRCAAPSRTTSSRSTSRAGTTSSRRAPSMRLTTDLFAYCEERIPRWNTISICGYHIREAGSTAVQELAFTLANGIAYCRGRRRGGALAGSRSARGSPSSSTRTTTSSRRWRSSARRGGCGRGSCRERFGATNPKALALRFHAQTGGSTLTAQQPENNIVRVAIQALSAVAGGAQSLHTNSFDEALALPTEHAAHDRAAHAADPRGGGGHDRHGRSARRLVLHRVADRRARGARVGADRARRRARRRGRGRRVRASSRTRSSRPRSRGSSRSRRASASIVGVNALPRGGVRDASSCSSIDPAAEQRQLERTARVRAERNADDAARALAAVRETARGEANLLPADARRAARALHRRRDLRDAARGVGDVRRAAPARLDAPRRHQARRRRAEVATMPPTARACSGGRSRLELLRGAPPGSGSRATSS